MSRVETNAVDAHLLPPTLPHAFELDAASVMWLAQSLPTHLYLFHHVGKCAGTSLVEAFGKTGRAGICLGFACENKHEVRRVARQTLVQRRLSPRLLRIFFGHRVYHGLHHLAPHPPRYFTFLRHPVSRVISLYNYHCGIATDPTHPHHRRDRGLLAPSGKLIAFQKWFEEQYTGNHLVRFLSYAMDEERVHVPQPMTRRELHAAQRFLEHCWFIGLTEQSQHDIPRVCQAVGVPTPRKRSNVSQQHLSAAEKQDARRLIEQTDELDLELYEFACQLRGAVKSHRRARVGRNGRFGG